MPVAGFGPRRSVQSRPNIDYVARAVENIGATLRRGPRDAEERIARLRERIRSKAAGGTSCDRAIDRSSDNRVLGQIRTHDHDPPPKRQRLEGVAGHGHHLLALSDHATPASSGMAGPPTDTSYPSGGAPHYDHGGGPPRRLLHRLDPPCDHRLEAAPEVRGSPGDSRRPQLWRDGRPQPCESDVHPVRSHGGGLCAQGAPDPSGSRAKRGRSPVERRSDTSSPPPLIGGIVLVAPRVATGPRIEVGSEPMGSRLVQCLAMPVLVRGAAPPRPDLSTPWRSATPSCRAWRAAAAMLLVADLLLLPPALTGDVLGTITGSCTRLTGTSSARSSGLGLRRVLQPPR